MFVERDQFPTNACSPRFDRVDDGTSLDMTAAPSLDGCNYAPIPSTRFYANYCHFIESVTNSSDGVAAGPAANMELRVDVKGWEKTRLVRNNVAI
jgi:hypothetical protein